MKPMGALPPEFAGQRGRLTIAGRPADDWAEATPVFVYDVGIVAARVARFRAAFPDVDLHYAIKANPLPALLDRVAPLVDGLDVASGGELDKALAVKPASAISFAGPGKRDVELRAAIGARHPRRIAVVEHGVPFTAHQDSLMIRGHEPAAPQAAKETLLRKLRAGVHHDVAGQILVLRS